MKLQPLRLERYQLYTSEEETTTPYKHSLAHSLTLLGKDISTLEVLINGGIVENPSYKFPLNNMKSLANRIGTNIRLRLDHNNKTVLRYYPCRRPYDTTVHLCVIDGHYFIDEQVLEKGEKTSSWEVLSRLYENNQVNFDPPEDTCTGSKAIQVTLSNVMNEQTLFTTEVKTHKPRSYTVSYADIETITKPKHVPLMYGRYCNGSYRSISCGADTNWEGFAKFLGTFPDGDNIVYFHNLKFDWTVIKNNPHMRLRSVLKKDGEYYMVKFTFYKKRFELRDSYKYIPKKLSEFPKMFCLNNLHKHEYILYDLYTLENCSLDDYVTYRDMTQYDVPVCIYNLTSAGVTKLVDKDIDCSKYILLDERVAIEREFISIVPLYFSGGTCGKYYHIAHCEYYLQSDCEILYRGMEKYRETMLLLTSVDCHNKLTLPSMIHEKLCMDGCYNGVGVLSDNLRRFVNESISGGRVTTKDNKMWDIDCSQPIRKDIDCSQPIRKDIDCSQPIRKGKLYVLDGRSLYPSAIHRLCNPTKEDKGRIAGIPLGKALHITDWSLKDTFDHYVVRINVIAIKKHQQIAFVNFYNKTRVYTNDVCDGLRGIVVDKITLEDWVEFQHIEYEFIEGVYWQSGGHTLIGDVVKNLYDARRTYIVEGNTPMSEICKLSLNSLYGKTIIKPNDVKLVIKNNSDVPEYIANQFNNLIDMEECCNQSIISINNNDAEHSNMCHIGGIILSMARRIMNEVLNLCTDLDINVFYTDTDSMHVLGDEQLGLHKLEQGYRDRFFRELIGSDLGQFSYELKYPNHTDIYSERVIILGKKVYIHQVSGVSPEGIREIYSHCRMKGVNTFAMSEYPDKLALYERLYSGEVIPFDLTYGDGVSFQFKDTVITRETFIKNISFKGEKGSILL
jgi:hypothetical protein